MKRLMTSCLLVVMTLLLPSARSAEVVFYRCTDASGALTLQNMPCPKGHKEERKVMQSVGSTPAGKVAPAAVAGPAIPALQPAEPAKASPPEPAQNTTPSSDQAQAQDALPQERLPPPVLFQCTTYDKDSYVTESDEPQSRCVTIRTVGLDGNPQNGAGEACEMKHDDCARVPDGALCDAWKKRMGETEVAWRFARTGNEEKNKEEYERTRRIWSESTCGAPEGAQKP